MEPQIIPMEHGQLTCQVRGGQAEVFLEVRPDRPGLYRGILTGPAGRRDLGLLLPEAGCLRLRRTLDIEELDRAGCWPVRGCRAVLAHAFDRGGAQGEADRWRPLSAPGGCFPQDPVLARAAAETREWFLCRREDGTFSLAAPWDPCRPFPLVPAFCLAGIRTRAGRRWAVYRFRADGTPVLPDGER